MRVSGFEQNRRCFGQYSFIRPPRSPSEKEAEISECSNYVWPDLSFGRFRSGQESVHVNVDHTANGTLFPFGGHLCTHWEYPAAALAEPASVSTLCQPDLDGCPLWYIPESQNPLIFPLHFGGSVWEEGGGGSNLGDRLVSFCFGG